MDHQGHFCIIPRTTMANSIRIADWLVDTTWCQLTNQLCAWTSPWWPERQLDCAPCLTIRLCVLWAGVSTIHRPRRHPPHSGTEALWSTRVWAIGPGLPLAQLAGLRTRNGTLLSGFWLCQGATHGLSHWVAWNTKFRRQFIVTSQFTIWYHKRMAPRVKGSYQ